MMILDGGMGRALEDAGAPFRQPEWSATALIEQPESVLDVHNAFIEAGADIITTNTYALVPFHIGQKRYDEHGHSLLTLAGELAQQAKHKAKHPVKIAAGIPPLFGSYKPHLFDYQSALPRFEQFKKHLMPFADLFLIETVSSVDELKAFYKVFAEVEKPLWVSLSLQDHVAENAPPKIRDGTALAEVIKILQTYQVDALLFNCSQPEVMADAIAMAVQSLPKHIAVGVYANAFPAIVESESAANNQIMDIRQDLTPMRYKAFAEHWQQLGAQIIGGCCGVGVEHIKALSTLKSKQT